MIRAAGFIDTPRIVELLVEAYQRSIYLERGAIDLKEAKALVVNSIQRHGLKSAGGTRVMVSEGGGRMTGFLIGILDRVYHIGDKLMASDLFFYVSPGADPRHAAALLMDFTMWAEGNAQVIEITLGVSNAVGDPEAVEGLYTRAGFARSGAMYERRIER